MSTRRTKTREKILLAAWKLLEASPPISVRMSDIAKETGISRQALYQHFPARSELLIATARYLDEVKDVDVRLAPSRSAKSGAERLDAFIEAWGNYIPEIYGVAKAFLAMKDTDPAVAAAWEDRMQAVKHGCNAVILALKKDGTLSPNFPPKKATDILWTMLSVRNWEQYRFECGFSQRTYIKTMKQVSKRLLFIDTTNSNK